VTVTFDHLATQVIHVSACGSSRGDISTNSEDYIVISSSVHVYFRYTACVNSVYCLSFSAYCGR